MSNPEQQKKMDDDKKKVEKALDKIDESTQRYFEKAISF